MNASDGNAMDQHFEDPASGEAPEAGGMETELPPAPDSGAVEAVAAGEAEPVETADAGDGMPRADEPESVDPAMGAASEPEGTDEMHGRDEQESGPQASRAGADREVVAEDGQSAEPAPAVEEGGAAQDAAQPSPAGIEDGEEEDEPLPPGVVRPPDEELVEALLFATPEPLTIKTIREIVDPEMTIPKLNAIIRGINKKMDAAGCAFEVVPAAAGYRFRTRPVYYPWVKKLFREQGARRLSQAALETLAVVAYKQPITKAEIEAVRGVAVDGALKTLLDRKLVSTTGRSDQPGKALTYGTTREFLQYFGIQRVPEDLPRLSEFEELVQSQSLVPQFRMGTLEERARDDA